MNLVKDNQKTSESKHVELISSDDYHGSYAGGGPPPENGEYVVFVLLGIIGFCFGLKGLLVLLGNLAKGD